MVKCFNDETQKQVQDLNDFTAIRHLSMSIESPTEKINDGILSKLQSLNSLEYIILIGPANFRTIRPIMVALINNTILSHQQIALTLHSISFDRYDDTSELSELLKQLHTLVISTCSIGQRFNALQEALKHNTTIKTLTIHSNNSMYLLNSIFDALADNRTIEGLVFVGDSLKNVNIIRRLEQLCKNSECTIKTITLYEANIYSSDDIFEILYLFQNKGCNVFIE